MRIFLFLIFPFVFYFSLPQGKVSIPHCISSKDTLTATDSILQFWLKPDGVDDDKPIARTFYFWTSVAELDSVSQQHALLRSQYNQDCFIADHADYRKKLEDKKWNKNPVANLLREGQFGRMRSSWPCYWSELICDTSDHLQTQLVKVELEDSALLVVFRPQNKIPWEVFDLNGRLIPESEFEKRQDQVAAVYYSDHVNIKVGGFKLDYFERTFFLCNEKIIRVWHHDVPGMQKRIMDDIKYLLLLDAYFGSDAKKTLAPGENGKNVVGCWNGEPKDFSIAQYYFRTQLFADTDKPEAFPFAIDEIIGTLRFRFPRQVNPMENFPSKGIR